MSNFLIKYHYLLMYLSLVLFGIINSTASLTSGMYIILIVSVLVWGAVSIINKHYLRIIHTVRVVANCLTLIIMMVLLTLQSVAVLNPSQTTTPALTGLIFIFLALTLNLAVFLKI